MRTPIAGLVLAWIAMALLGGGALDRGFMIALHAGERAGLAEAARFVTALGGWEVLVPLTIAGAAWLGYRRRMRDALLLLALSFGGRFLVELQKYLVARPRPEAEQLIGVESMSFPSGHAANSTIVYLALAIFLTERRPQRALAVWAAAWLAIAIGLSRTLLGVHWLSEVTAGWAFGLLWTLSLLGLAGYPLGDGTPRPLRHSSPEGDGHDRPE